MHAVTFKGNSREDYLLTLIISGQRDSFSLVSAGLFCLRMERSLLHCFHFTIVKNNVCCSPAGVWSRVSEPAQRYVCSAQLHMWRSKCPAATFFTVWPESTKGNCKITQFLVHEWQTLVEAKRFMSSALSPAFAALLKDSGKVHLWCCSRPHSDEGGNASCPDTCETPMHKWPVVTVHWVTSALRCSVWYNPPCAHNDICVCSQEALQMVREGKRQGESSAWWKRGGHPSGTLMKLQQRAQKTAEDWLDCYRVAVGTCTLTVCEHGLSSFPAFSPCSSHMW